MDEELNPMSAGSPVNQMGGSTPVNPTENQPQGSIPMGNPPQGGTPMGPIGPAGPVGVDPMLDGGGDKSKKIYLIALGVTGVLLVVFLVLTIVFVGKANKTTAYIDQKVSEAKDVKEKEARAACDIEEKEIKENPWANFTARDEFGAFKFIVPRNWSQYEHFDINANDPYSLYFSDTMVSYDSAQSVKKVHSPLEVTVSKKLYDAEINDIQNKIKNSKDANKTEDKVTISNFDGTKFVYNDKDTGKKVGVIIMPYRDRALYIKTDDYEKWNEKYYDKFWKSFALTP